LKRLFDITLALVLLSILLMPMLVIGALVRLTSKGPALYWSDRVGRFNVIYRMPKFRSMLINTPAVATHLLDNPDQYLSPIGSFLRRTSLDELPQLWSVIKGDMGFVGPRPALFNQKDLIEARTEAGIDRLRPGITGWAQVNGRDGLSIIEKLEFDLTYFRHQSFWFDMKILFMTLVRVLKRSGVSH